MYAVIALIAVTIFTWIVAIWATFDAEEEVTPEKVAPEAEQNHRPPEELKHVA